MRPERTAEQIASDAAAERRWQERMSAPGATPKLHVVETPPTEPQAEALTAANVFHIESDADALPPQYRDWRGAPISLSAAWVLAQTIGEEAREEISAIAGELDELRAKIAAVELENAQLRASLAEAGVKIAEAGAEAPARSARTERRADDRADRRRRRDG
jgi:hypothetical protein